MKGKESKQLLLLVRMSHKFKVNKELRGKIVLYLPTRDMRGTGKGRIIEKGFLRKDLLLFLNWKEIYFIEGEWLIFILGDLLKIIILARSSIQVRFFVLFHFSNKNCGYLRRYTIHIDPF